ncbi:hypothetical protein CVIRNUC_000428 [Coccomyxa viridis]|uniref:Protein kinase domain-containing protein n=1 Tax=Coccomyxa viridis TaxID=1274662 RepID=A0AAV1HR32_9CHLO|nr:hypothetical protein CVIRNUC_000428 [Coccomyxa viridis]
MTFSSLDDLKKHLVAARQWSAFPRQGNQARLPRMLGKGDCCPVGLARIPLWSLSDFRLMKKVGEGALSEVFQAMHIPSRTTVAVKLYTKASLTHFTRRQIEREIELQSRLRHPHIVQLYGAFEDHNSIVLVEEYASMGNLLRHISRIGSLSEAHIVQNVMQPVLQALLYLHEQGIIHRDLKPENLLLAGGILKLADFGTAINTRQERAVSRVGTLDQMAPEVLECPDRSDPQLHKGRIDLAYNTSADVWALGVLTHELLTGKAPFAQLTQQQTIEAILSGVIATVPLGISEAAQDFLSACLQRNPSTRPSVTHLLDHSWIQGQHGESRALLLLKSLSQASLASSVERHSSEESETIVCSLLASPEREEASSASPVKSKIVRAGKYMHDRLCSHESRTLSDPLLRDQQPCDAPKHS